MNTSWTNAALLQRRPIFIALLLCCFFVNARAQVTVWQENFAGANQGWTDNFVDCDGTMQSFAGVANGRYEVTDMEGAPCCAPQGGGNENEWVTNPIDIEDYCSVDISVTYGFVGTFECSAGGPYFGCQANPTINNGHDQIVFEYSINGGAWVQFGYVCGGQTGTVTATGLVGNDIRIRIRPSNKSTQETYWFDNVTVTGNVGPTVNQPADVTACANTVVNVPFTGSAGATFSWTNNNTAIGLGASGTGNINFTTANVGAITTGTITVTPINGCNGQPVTFDITVNPIPFVNDPPNQAVCSNEQVNVIFTGNAGTYNWTNSNPAIGLPASGSGDLNFTATAGPATGTITVQPVQGACIGTAQTFTITINTAPVINAVADVTVCGGGGVNTIFTGTPGAQYTWTNSNPAIGLAASGTGNVVFTSANPANVETGTITVTPAIGTCQGNPEIFTVTVNPTPTVVDPPNQTVCSGEQVDVVFNGNGGPAFNWTNSNTAIGLGATGSGNIGFTAANVVANTTGNITVTPVANGCTGAPQNFTLTVTPLPVATQPADVIVCGGTNVTVMLAAQPGAAVLSWTNSNPAIGLPASGTGNIVFSAAGVTTQQTALITVTPTLGLCTGLPVTFDITIDPSPEVNLNPVNLAVCGGAPILLDLLANASPGATLTWTNNNTSTGIPASGTGNINETAAPVTAVQVSTVVITPTLGACTGPTETATVTVNPTPTLTQPADLTACGGQNVAVTLAGQPAGAAFSWTNDNTAIGLGASGSGNINFVAAQVANAETGQISVTPILGACTGTVQTFDITVNPTPEVNLNPTALAVCGGQPINVDLSANATPGATFTWTNNNVNTGIPASGSGNIAATAATVTTAQVSVISVTPTLGVCAGTPETITVTVNPTPTATLPADQTACGGQTVSVNLTGQPAATTVSWTNTNTAIGLAASGTGNINFTAAAVAGAETGQITITPTLGACTGVAQTFDITVNPTPAVNLNPTTLAVCGGEPIQINLSANATPGSTLTWTNNNVNTGIPASGSGDIDATAAAVTTVQVSVVSAIPTLGACTGPAQAVTVTVNPLPTLNQPGDETACGGENVVVAFTGQPAGTVFSWTNDNPAIGLPASGAGNLNFVTSFPANTEIGQITATPTLGVCTGAAQTFSITVEPTPELNLNPASSAVCGGEPILIDFEANALPGTAFIWTNNNTDTGIPASGTGNIIEIAAIVTADEVSTITITPTLGLCTGLTETYTLTVVPEPTVLSPGDETACGGQTVNIGLSGTNGAAFNWTNDNVAIGLPAFGSGPINFTASVVGSTETATILVTPTLGACTGDPIQFTITVDPGPQLTLNPTNLSTCGGESIQVDLAANATPGSSFTWTNNNPAIGLPAAGTGNIDFVAAVVAVPQTGIITITPTLGACVGTPEQLTVVVVTTPEVNLAPTSLTVCSGEPIVSNFAANATPGATFAWTNNNTATGIPAAGTGNISATASNVAAPTVSTIAVTPSLGTCTGVAENYTVTVVPEPTVVNPGNLTFCGGEMVTLAFSGTPGAAVSWTNNNPAIGLTASGSGDLMFTATNPVAPDTALITLTPLLGACDGPAETFFIIVNPAPVVNAQGDSSFCGLSPVSLAFSGTAGTVFTWTNDNPAIGLPAAGVGNLNFTSSDVNAATTANIVVTAELGVCESAPITFDLTINPTYIVSAQMDAAACGGQTLNFNFTSTGGNPPVSWTNSNPAIGLPANGTGAINFVAPVLAGDESAQIVVTPFQGTPGCPGMNDTFNINVVTSPVVNNPGDQSLCGGAAVNVPLLGTPAAQMNWTNDNPAIGLPVSGTGSLAFTAANVSVPTSATITVSPGLNGCAGADQSFTITVNPAPTADISGTALVCEGNSTTLTASGGVAYQWVGGPATAAFVVTPADTTVYVVTVTGAGGCTDVDSIAVAVLPLNNTIQNLQSCNPADTGIVIDVFLNQFGCDSVVTSIIALLPTDTTMINLVTCDPGNAGSISFVVPNQFGCDSLIIVETTFDPSFVDTTYQLATTCDPSAVGTFVEVFNVNGCDSVAFTIVAFDPGLLDTTLLINLTCDPAQVGEVQQVFPGADGCDSLVITQTLLLPNDTTLISTTTCNINEAGVFTAVFATSTCDSVVVTTVVYDPTLLDTVLLNLFTCDPDQVGIVVELFANSTGCDSLVITETILLPIDTTIVKATTCRVSEEGTFTVVIPTSTCDSVVITTVVFDPELIDTTIVQLTTCNVAMTDTTVVVLTGNDGCDSVVITQTTLDFDNCPLQANLLATGVLCAGDTNGMATFSVVDGDGPFGYTWTDALGQTGSGPIAGLNVPVVVNGISAGLFSVTITGNAGMVSNTFSVSVPGPAPVVAFAESLFPFGPYGVSCNGASDGIITATAQGGTPPYQYIWSNGLNAPINSGLPAGDFIVTATDQNGCSAEAEIELLEPEALALNIGVDAGFCGDTLFDVSLLGAGGAGPYVLFVNGDNIVGSFTTLEQGNYAIELVDANGCALDTNLVLVASNQPFVVLPEDTTIQLGQTLRIEAVTNLTSWASLQWSPLPDSLNPNSLVQTWQPAATQLYSLTLTDTLGCSATASILVRISRELDVFVPNVFSPDGDGFNDVWLIGAGPSIGDLSEVAVFDRWGNEVYYWDNRIRLADWPGWDGRAGSGDEVEVGVYVYYVRVKRMDGEELILKGDVTVVNR